MHPISFYGKRHSLISEPGLHVKNIICLIIALSSLSALAQDSKRCMAKAENVILNKGQYRGETTTLRWTSPSGENDKYEAYDVYVTVDARKGSFDQVCRIIMKKSNCSYDNTYGCASRVEELDQE